MANRTFDRTVLNQRERPLSSDLNQAQSESDETVRRVLDLMSRRRNGSLSQSPNVNETRFFGDGFKVNPTGVASSSLVLRAGMGLQVNAADVPLAIGGVIGVNDVYADKPLMLDGDLTIGPVPANGLGGVRVDIIEVKYNRRLEDNSSRDVLDIGTGTFNPTLVNKTLAFILDATMVTINGAGAVNYKTGTVIGVAATTDVGYVKVAEIRVPLGYVAAPLSSDVIVDTRRMPGPVHGSASWITPIAVAAPNTLRYSAPPGFEIAIQRTGASNCTVWIWGGDPGASAVVNLTVNTGQSGVIVPAPQGGIRIAGLFVAQPTIGALSAADQAIINGGPNSITSALVAETQRVMKFQTSVLEFVGGAFVAPTLADSPMQLTFGVMPV